MGQDAGRGCVMGATRHTRPARRRLGEVLSVWLASSDSVGVAPGRPALFDNSPRLKAGDSQFSANRSMSRVLHWLPERSMVGTTTFPCAPRYDLKERSRDLSSRDQADGLVLATRGSQVRSCLFRTIDV